MTTRISSVSNLIRAGSGAGAREKGDRKKSKQTEQKCYYSRSILKTLFGILKRAYTLNYAQI